MELDDRRSTGEICLIAVGCAWNRITCTHTHTHLTPPTRTVQDVCILNKLTSIRPSTMFVTCQYLVRLCQYAQVVVCELEFSLGSTWIPSPSRTWWDMADELMRLPRCAPAIGLSGAMLQRLPRLLLAKLLFPPPHSFSVSVFPKNG